MYEGRSDEMSAQNNEKYYQYDGQHYEPYTTIIGQSGLPMNIPYGLFQYAKYQEDPRNVKVKDSLRRGKWTDEEVKLTDRIIETFNAGSLELDPETAGGVTLRSYLSEKLGCDPMRITKKYTGASCLGKRVYHSANTKASREVVEAVKIELAMLEVKFREKLEKNSRDRLGLEADVDKHLRNQVVSTPSIDAMMMQGSGCRKVGPSNMGFWPMQDTSMQSQLSNPSSSSSSVPSTSKRSLPAALPTHINELEARIQSSTSRTFYEEVTMKVASELAAIQEVQAQRNDIKKFNTDEVVTSSSGAASRCVRVPKTKKKPAARFPYSRYYDPSTPKENAKEGFELSASSYYYAPSAQEIEASKVQQQKQKQYHMLLLQQQQQQQHQQYYLSLEKSSDLPYVPKKSSLTHCVPTLANIGGVKRAVDSSDGQPSHPESKMSKIDHSRNLNDLPLTAFLKNGNNIHGGSVGYQGMSQGGQGLLITVPVVSDMSTNGNSNDDCSSGSGGGSPDAAGSDGVGSGSTLSGTISDEGEGEGEGDTSDDNRNSSIVIKSESNVGQSQSQSLFSFRSKEYNKVSNIVKSSKKASPSGHSYEYKTFGANPSLGNADSYGSNIARDKCEKKDTQSSVKVEYGDKNVAVDVSRDEALLSMMSFFTHCHQVESEKDN